MPSAEGREVREVRRIGKRIAMGLEGDLWLVLHLMIAGRLHWRPPEAKLAGRHSLAAFDFPDGSLVLTEAGAKRRASLHVLGSEEALRSLDPGGIDVFTTDVSAFRTALAKENHTLKRALTDPRFVSGIGNAYSDEILHAAQLSPIMMTQKLQQDEWERLFTATRHTLEDWTKRLRAEAGTGFPRRSQRFARTWRSMDGSVSRARGVARKFSVSVTPIRKRIIVPDVRQVGKYSPIVACRVC